MNAVLLAVFGVTFILALPPSVNARDFASGTMLAKACAAREAKEASLCDGYIAGALDEVAGNASLRDQICPPADTKLSVLRGAVARYAQEHATDVSGSGVDLLHATLKATYPCKH